MTVSVYFPSCVLLENFFSKIHEAFFISNRWFHLLWGSKAVLSLSPFFPLYFSLSSSLHPFPLPSFSSMLISWKIHEYPFLKLYKEPSWHIGWLIPRGPCPVLISSFLWHDCKYPDPGCIYTFSPWNVFCRFLAQLMFYLSVFILFKTFFILLWPIKNFIMWDNQRDGF